MMEQSERRLGNYRLLSLIGQGGFADVYLGEHIYLKTQAAIKALRTQLAQDNMNNFLAEAQTIAYLRHPHIVRVLECGVENNTPFLVMDYAPKGTLRKLYPRGTQLPLGIIVPAMKQVAEALQYAHDQRYIHRDIKPENMLIGANNEILLSDFGIATMAQSSHYQTRDIVGTVSYMAPEQIQGKPRPASDQYALATVVYEWLTGTCPYHGSFTEVAAQQMYAPLPPLRSVLPNISPDVEQVLTIALAKDPDRRFASVQALSRALEQACGGDETLLVGDSTILPAAPYPALITVTPPPAAPVRVAETPLPTIFAYPNTPPPAAYTPVGFPPPAAVQPEPRPHTRRYVLLAGLGALALAGGGLATWEWLSHRSSPRLATDVTPTSAPKPTQTAQPDPTATTQPDPTATAGPTVPTIATFAGPSQTPLYAVSWSPTNAAMIAIGGQDSHIYVWQYVAQTTVASYITPAAKVFHVAWSPDGNYLAAAMGQGYIQIWDTSSGQMVFSQQAHNNEFVNCVAWSPDGSSLVSGGGDGTAIVWNVAQQQQMFSYALHTSYINAVAWSHNGNWIVSGGGDYTAQVWSARDGTHLLTYSQHTRDVLALAWGPGDSRVASASDDGTVRIWDSQSGATYIRYGGHTGYVVAMGWSPDGALIASGGVDTTVQVWEAASGALQRIYRGHAAEVEGVTWSPDSTKVASASDDTTVRVWPAR